MIDRNCNFSSFISGIMGDKVDIKAQKLIYNIEDIDAETVNLIVDEIEYIDRPVEDKSDTRTEYNIGVDMGIDGKLHYSARFAHKDDDDVFSIYASPETWEGMQEIFDAFKAGKMPFFRDEIFVKEEKVEEEQPEEEVKEEEKPMEEVKQEEKPKPKPKLKTNGQTIKETMAFLDHQMDREEYPSEEKVEDLKHIEKTLKALANSDPATQQKVYEKCMGAADMDKMRRANLRDDVYYRLKAQYAVQISYEEQPVLSNGVYRNDDNQPELKKVVLPAVVAGFTAFDWMCLSVIAFFAAKGGRDLGAKVGNSIGNSIEGHGSKPTIYSTPTEERKPTIYSTPAEERKPTIYSTPVEERKPQIFYTPEGKEKFVLPGFEVEVGEDLRILYKDGDTGETNYEYWNKYVEFKGNKVFQRDDLIDLNQIDPNSGLTNLELMKLNKAPKGPDGKPIHLHHLIQTTEGGIAEVTQTMHQKYSKILHINSNNFPSDIDRNKFKQWRENYWENRAKDFETEI